MCGVIAGKYRDGTGRPNKRIIVVTAAGLCLLLKLIFGPNLITKAQTVAEKPFKPELVVQTGHTTQVNSVAFSPDGKTLASGSADNSIKLWVVETGQQIKSLDGHIDLVYLVAFSPDGKTLVSGSWDRSVKLWDVETGQLLKSLEGHTAPVNSVTFSSNGNILLSGNLDGTMKIWDVETSENLATLISLGKED